MGNRNSSPSSLCIILLAVMLVTILTIPMVQSVEAKKSAGTLTGQTMSKQICGVSFCNTEQEWSIEDNINEHIVNLLNSQEDFVTQSADTDENGDALQSDGINSKLSPSCPPKLNEIEPSSLKKLESSEESICQEPSEYCTITLSSGRRIVLIKWGSFELIPSD